MDGSGFEIYCPLLAVNIIESFEDVLLSDNVNFFSGGVGKEVGFEI